MIRLTHSVLPRYLLAIVAVVLATLARLALDFLLGVSIPFPTFLLGILVVASYAGRGPALLAVGLAAASLAWFILIPRGSFAVEGRENQAGLVLFTIVGVGIALLGGALREAMLKAERHALESTRRWQELGMSLGRIGDAVLVTDAQGRIAFMNPIAEALIARRADRVVGEPVESILTLLDENTGQRVESLTSANLASVQVASSSHQCILIGGDGVERPIEGSTSLIRDEQGLVTGATIVFRDLSRGRNAERELRRNEERLRLFVEHSPAAVAMFDRRMNYLLASRRWLVEFGLGDIDLKGRNQYEVMPEIPERWKETHERCLAGAIERCEEDSYLTPSGGREWLRWETRPWRDDRGEIGGIIIFSENISDLVRNRQAIQTHAESLSGILAATVDNIYVIDRDGRYRLVSDGGARVMGFEPEQMVGRHWTELGLSPEVMEVYIEQFQDVIRSGRPAKHETLFISADGEPHEFEYTVAPIDFKGRKADAVVVVSRDITRHKIDERERLELLKTLETRNAFIDAVLTQVPAAIVVSDAKTGRILLSNNEAHRIVQHRYEPGRTLDDYGTTHIREAYRADGSRYKPGEWPLVRAQAGETVAGEEMELVMADEARVTIRVNAGPVLVGDEVVAAVVAYHDISSIKAAERAARFLAEASAMLAGPVEDKDTLQRVASLAVPAFADWAVVDMLDPDGTIKRLAVAHADPSKADLAFEVHRRFPADPEALHGPANVLRTGQSEFHQEFTDERLVAGASNEEHLKMLRRLGVRSYLCVPLTIRGERLGVLGFALAESGRLYEERDLAIAEDLASRAAIAIENARLYDELKQADRMKNEFLATLAHELRNPLTPIRNALHLMKEPSLRDGDNEANRAMAERQVVHLTRLIDDLMDVARIARGKIEIQKQVVNLATIVNQAVETSRPQIDERHHQLLVTLPEREVALEADPTRLEQILWNLLNNAAKYTDPGGLISLSVHPSDSEVLIRVRDTGIGIRPEMLAWIFEMFTQVEDHRNLAGGGLGIGLGLVHALVEMHGGSITAESGGPGQGSEFRVRLPILQTVVADRLPDSRGDAAKILGRVCRRILIVDDNEDAARSLAKILRRSHGQEVEIAHDGPEALTLAEEFRPEVILLDIGLPLMNGYEVARSIRASTWGIDAVIIALTGWGQEEDRRRSREAGFNHHLVKPVDPALLEQLLAD